MFACLELDTMVMGFIELAYYRIFNSTNTEFMLLMYESDNPTMWNAREGIIPILQMGKLSLRLKIVLEMIKELWQAQLL